MKKLKKTYDQELDDLVEKLQLGIADLEDQQKIAKKLIEMFDDIQDYEMDQYNLQMGNY